MKDRFWEVADNFLLTVPPPFEDFKEDKNYLILFDDHPERDDVLIAPCSILRIRVEKGSSPAEC